MTLVQHNVSLLPPPKPTHLPRHPPSLLQSSVMSCVLSPFVLSIYLSIVVADVVWCWFPLVRIQILVTLSPFFRGDWKFITPPTPQHPLPLFFSSPRIKTCPSLSSTRRYPPALPLLLHVVYCGLSAWIHFEKKKKKQNKTL